MIDFDEFVVMKEKFLKKLNVAIDKIIEEKQSMDMDHDLIEKSLKAIIKNNNVNTKSLSAVTPIDKGQILSITLDFFKSIDSEFYKKAIEIILQQNKYIKMNVYNVHDIKNFEVRDENNLLQYSTGGMVQIRNGNAVVSIPTRAKLNDNEEKSINKDSCTLEDLYTIVHEISHCFDLNFDIEKLTSEELVKKELIYEDNITRELTGEATAIAFEEMLSEYLLKNKLYSKEVIEQINNNRVNSCLKNARIVYAKLLLAREKEEKGEVTLEFIEKNMRDYNLSIQDVRHMATYIINSPKDMYMQRRYAIGGLIAPTIIKAYKRKGSSALKRYLEEAKNCNLESALKAIGIQLDEQGISELINNYNGYVHNINEEER